MKYIKFDVILDSFYEIDKINTDTSFKHYQETTENSRIRNKKTQKIYNDIEQDIKAFDIARHAEFIRSHPGSRRSSISKSKPQDSNTTRKYSFQRQSRRPSLSKLPISASTAATAESTPINNLLSAESTPRKNLSLHRSASTATTAASTEVNTAVNTPRENSLSDITQSRQSLYAKSTPRKELSLSRAANTAASSRQNSMLDGDYLYNENDDDHLSENTKSVKLK